MVRRKTKRTKIEGDFARALSSEVAKAGSLSHRAASARLRRLERHYVPMLPAKSRDALEMRRRIAEQIYQHALLHGSSPAVCRIKLKTLSKLGFTDIERKAHFYLLHARAALSRRELRLARTTATAIMCELDDAPRHGGNPLRKELLRLIKTLLQQLSDHEAAGIQ